MVEDFNIVDFQDRYLVMAEAVGGGGMKVSSVFVCFDGGSDFPTLFPASYLFTDSSL